MDRSRLEELHRAVRRVVKRAARPGGSLERKSFTMAMARGEVERRMGLEGQLGEGEWRGLVKAEVNGALAEIDNITSEEEDVPLPRNKASASSSRRASGRSATQGQGDKVGPGRSVKSAPVRRKDQRSEDETSEEAEEAKHDGTDSAGEEYGAKTKVKVGKGRRGGEVESARGAKGGKGGKGKRRLETPSEEESVGEADQHQEAGQDDASEHEKENESEMSSVYDEPPRKASTKAAAGTKQAKQAKQAKGKDDIKIGGRTSGPSKAKEKEDVAELSESEMSSVYDVAPTKKRRSRESSDKSGKKAKTKKAKKDPNEGLSPDEAKVNDLKRIVVACGVRKQWSKEFADCPTTKAQIQHLQRILSELGMRGNPTMGKARSLKEARELAAELNDVKEFEAARGLSAGRPSRRRSGPAQRVIESDDEEPQSGNGEDEEDRKESALGAVLDFLDELSS